MEDNNKFQTGRVITIATGHAVHDTYSAFLAPVLPLFVKNLFLNRAEAGLLTVFIQAPSLIQPLIGHLADRYNLHHLVFMTPAVSAVLMSLIGIPSSYAVLAILLITAGINSALLHAVGPVMVGKISGRSLGRGMSIWMVGGELGRTLGPIVVVTAVAHLTLRGLPCLMVVGLLATFLLYVEFRKVPVDHHPSDRSYHWKQAVGNMKPILMPLIGVIVGRAFVMAAMTIYLPLFLTEEGSSLWLAGASLTILQGAGVAGAFLGGSISDKLGRRFMLLLSFLATPVFISLFLGFDGWIHFPLLILIGLTGISTTPVIMALVQENFPENRALANGIYMSLSFCLRSGIVLLVGLMGDSLGLRLTFWCSAVIMILSFPFALWLTHTRVNKQSNKS